MGLVVTFGVPLAAAGVLVGLQYFGVIDLLTFDMEEGLDNRGAAEKCVALAEQKYGGSFDERGSAHQSPEKVMKYNLNGEDHTFFAKIVPISRPSEHKQYYPLVVWNRTADELFDYLPDVSSQYFTGKESLFQHPSVRDKLASQGYKTKESNDSPDTVNEIRVGGQPQKPGDG